MSELPFAVTTPVSIARVGLRARDAARLADYYRTVVGLEELGSDGETITLGAGGRPLLVLESDTHAAPEDPRSAGLFHTAFLLPSRADLGRWIRHATTENIALEGASDHKVSEALYLTDPEGNGIEIYADRRPSEWKRDGSAIEVATLRLDLADVLGSVPEQDAGWRGAPKNTVVGHVHLKVGDPRQAEEWWRRELGFDTVARYGGAAVFLSSGGYHHHIGANSWRSAGAGRREPGRSGLAWVEMQARDGRGAFLKEDPWGNQIRCVLAPV